MKVVEIREMSSEDIKEELEKSREELMRVRFQITTGELADTSQLHILKKKIARLMTILHERKTAENMDGDA
jgi:large subunit ribosomal protein L29